MSSFGANDLIFNNDENSGIYTGGFSIHSIMLKNGISPIMTINKEQHGGSNNVSDLFSSDLVVPNWAYSSGIGGGKHRQTFDSDDDDNDIDNDLHDKLLDLVRVHENELKQKYKKTRKNIHSKSKKGGTKRNK